jgi:hypothetical protein
MQWNRVEIQKKRGGAGTGKEEKKSRKTAKENKIKLDAIILVLFFFLPSQLVPGQRIPVQIQLFNHEVCKRGR